ncbi:MAG: NAD(P)/FAD-dependent oxidoreductase [Candidatus Hydrothermarchaeales archaeon]
MECDVLVVGSGISGSVAALSCLHHGSDKVLILEKASKVGGFTSQKIDFAEKTGLEDIIRKLKLPTRYLSYKSNWYSPSNARFRLNSKTADCWVKRGPSDDSFEVSAINSAVKKGAKLLLNSRVSECKKSSLTAKIDGKTEEIKAKVVIDAEGLNSNLANTLKIYENLGNSFTKIVGYGVGGYNFDMEEGVPEIFFSTKHASGSYVLLCKDPLDGVGYLIQGFREDKTVDIKQHFQNLVEKNDVIKAVLKNAEIIQNIHGTLYITDSLPVRFRSNNVLFVGDSARLMDPFLHYGVKPAIISGYLAGKVASNIYKGCDLDEYDKMIKEVIFPELKTQHKNRKVFNKLSDNDLNTLFEFLIELREKNTDFDALFENPYGQIPRILTILAKNPSRIPLSLKLILVRGLS